MSKPITVRAHTDKNGSLKLDVETDVREADVEVVVVVNPVPSGNGGGWRDGSLEKTYGSLAGSGTCSSIRYAATGSDEIHALVQQLLRIALDRKYAELAAGSPKAASQRIAVSAGGGYDHLTPVGRGGVVLILVASIAMLFIVRRMRTRLADGPTR